MQLVPGEPDVPGPLPPHRHPVQEAAQGQGGGPAAAPREVHPDSREAHRHLHCGQPVRFALMI